MSNLKYRDMEHDVESLVIGLDLGGTNSVFGIVNRKGEVLVTTSIKTQVFKDVESYVDACVNALVLIVEEVGGMKKFVGWGLVLLCQLLSWND